MPLPTWYRFIRTLPAGLVGVFMLAGGIYVAVAPTTYRDPNNPKMVAYTNSIHPVVVVMGVVFAIVGLGLLYFGGSRYFRMPEGLREYTYEQLRLGQALAREIIRLTKDPEEYHLRSLEYEDDSEIRVDSLSYHWGRKPWRRFWNWVSFGGHSVSYTSTQPPIEADGILHVQELHLRLDPFTGKAERTESVDEYEIVEEPPVLQGELAEFVKYAIRETGEGEEWEELTEPRFRKVLVSREPRDDFFEHYKFMKQMGLDRPSVEELERALDKLKEW